MALSVLDALRDDWGVLSPRRILSRGSKTIGGMATNGAS
jgi:hypothetical protein